MPRLPKHLVEKALHKADNLNREDLLNKESLKQPINPNPTQKFYYVTTQYPANPPVKEIITSNWDILAKTKTSRPLLESLTI